MRFRQALLALVLTAALVPFAQAKPGNGNGNGNGNGKPGTGKPEKPGKPGKPSKDVSGTTFAIGQVVSTDDRILDVTGDYELAGAATTVSLSLTQDDRGRVTGEATIISADGSSTGPIPVNGHLQLTAQTNLRLQLNGSSSADDISLNIRGNWDGTAFQLTVKVGGAVPSTEVIALMPVNPERGFTIEDGSGSPQGKKQLRSMRTVLLPWGSVNARATESAKGDYLSFKIKTSKFGIDMRGNVEDDTTFTATRAQVKLGYGNVRIDLDSLEVTTSTLTTK